MVLKGELQSRRIEIDRKPEKETIKRSLVTLTETVSVLLKKQIVGVETGYLWSGGYVIVV